MNFDWLNYLKVASKLLEEVNISLTQESISSDERAINEAKLRSVISRAYYCAFCLARNYLRDVDHDLDLKNWKNYNINVHQYVIDTFRLNNKIQEYRNIGIKLERMRSLRNKADYEDIFFGLINQAKNTIKSAEEIINLLKKTRNQKKITTTTTW